MKPLTAASRDLAIFFFLHSALTVCLEELQNGMFNVAYPLAMR